MMAEKRVYALWDDLEPFDGGETRAISGEWKGKEALYLNQMNSAFFLREEVTFSSFRLEAEVAIPGEVGFVGLIFGAKNERNYELVYIAPIEIQYDPIINGSMTWQIYNGPAYQKPLPDTTGAWHRFAVEVGPEGAKVFLDDQPDPMLVISNLQHGGERLGKVGFWNYVPVYIRNFSIEEIPTTERVFSDPVQAGAISRRQPEAGAFLTEWMVKNLLMPERAEPWIKGIVEENGTLNLNRICEAKPGLVAEAKSGFLLQEETEALLSLGYSDSIRLWINDIEVYQGDWLWQPPSHDGRIRPDFVSVPVKWRKGVNTVRAEVTQREGFGWGVAVKTGLPWITHLSEEQLKNFSHI